MEKGKECCVCEADYKKEVDKLVDEVDGYTAEEHRKKEEEVVDAFTKKDEKK